MMYSALLPSSTLPPSPPSASPSWSQSATDDAEGDATSETLAAPLQLPRRLPAGLHAGVLHVGGLPLNPLLLAEQLVPGLPSALHVPRRPAEPHSASRAAAATTGSSKRGPSLLLPGVPLQPEAKLDPRLAALLGLPRAEGAAGAPQTGSEG
jgi:hypothetical protein